MVFSAYRDYKIGESVTITYQYCGSLADINHLPFLIFEEELLGLSSGSVLE
jgi:hypothetical protein